MTAEHALRYPTSAFEYELPPELIAQEPPAERGGSRMLVVERGQAGGAREAVRRSGGQRAAVQDRWFVDLPSFIPAGDLLVLNSTRVRHARLVGTRPSGAPAEVLLSLLGAPPDGFVVAWSEATVGGYLLERVLTPVQLTRIQQRVANLWPPRPYALGLAAAIVAESVVHSGRRSVHVLSLLDGEFGVRDRIAAIPAFVASTGIVGTRVPSLSTRERVLLETALGS